MILYRGRTKETYYLNPPGFPLGITLPDPNLFDRTIQTEKIRLHPEDLLLVYTDGITEAMNPQRELFSEERLLETMRREGHNNVENFVKRLQNHLLSFTSGYEQNDDITLVAVKESMEEADIKLKSLKDIFEKIEKKEGTLREACLAAGISPPTYYRYKKMYRFGAKEALKLTIQRNIKRRNGNLDRDTLTEEAEKRLNEILRVFEQIDSGEISIREGRDILELTESTYYRYRRLCREGGYRYLRDMLHGYTNISMRHLSIEVKTKMYDIIKNHPSFGPKKISELLSTDKYGNLEISAALIYEELKRVKLTTREKRRRFINRGGKKRLKPPGTPLLTLDGKIMVGFRLEEQKSEKNTLFAEPSISSGQAKESIITSAGS
jgi:ACT domain-containing protein